MRVTTQTSSLISTKLFKFVVMALSLSSMPLPTYPPSCWVPRQSVSVSVVTKCELIKDSAAEKKVSRLEVGSPIIVLEAPQMLKTAASVPCLRVNSGLVKPGDVGRIVSRKPKDVWAVRLTIGTYLIDGKYFKPLELDE